jgi:hypothetical protein
LKSNSQYHIGRLHAFRKIAYEELPEDDCHYLLRKDIMKDDGLIGKEPEYHVSLAWDWLNPGYTEEQIASNALSLLRRSLSNRKIKVKSLALYETCVFQAFKELACDKYTPNDTEMKLMKDTLPVLKEIVEFNRMTYTLLLENGVTESGYRKIGEN